MILHVSQFILIYLFLHRAFYFQNTTNEIFSLIINSFLYLRICMKYIDAAVVRLKSKTAVDEADLSLVERILAKETDLKIAYIFALDLILVGIDTVNYTI